MMTDLLTDFVVPEKAQTSLPVKSPLSVDVWDVASLRVSRLMRIDGSELRLQKDLLEWPDM